ncbi:MAG: hypothetical protein HQ558_06595 [Candidatus Omnitrophica bacterium]|nr:hypothetical protein [Candidatus Omnitrophota bacterium]
MLKIIGYLWIMAGILFLAKPQILKNSLQRKSLKKLRKYFVLLSFFLGGLLISIGWKFHGIMAKVVLIVGIISVFKGAFLIKGKVADRTVEWFAPKPLIYFRIGACFYILLGVIILLLH